MEEVQYRIGTVAFREESCPTWGTRSVQILEQLARWAREGWQISQLNASAHIRLRARGFCILLERPLREVGREGPPRGSGAPTRERAA